MLGQTKLNKSNLGSVVVASSSPDGSRRGVRIIEEEDSLIEHIETRRTDPFFGQFVESQLKRTDETMEQVPRKKMLSMSKRVCVVNGSLMEVTGSGKEQRLFQIAQSNLFVIQQRNDHKPQPVEEETEYESAIMTPQLTVGHGEARQDKILLQIHDSETGDHHDSLDGEGRPATADGMAEHDKRFPLNELLDSQLDASIKTFQFCKRGLRDAYSPTFLPSAQAGLKVVNEIPLAERALNDLITRADAVPETEYLKEDVFSSPKFAKNPDAAVKIMQMRFTTGDENATNLVKRSHVGHAKFFHEYEDKIKENEELIKLAVQQNSKRRKTTASKIVILRKKLSSSRASVNGKSSICQVPSAFKNHQSSIRTDVSPTPPVKELSEVDEDDVSFTPLQAFTPFNNLQTQPRLRTEQTRGGRNKLKAIVPIINTETLQNGEDLNEEITFREPHSSRDCYPDKLGEQKTRVSDVFADDLGTNSRYFSRRTVSVNPERQLCAMKRLQGHQQQWGTSIGYFQKKRMTETEQGTKTTGTSLMVSQRGTHRVQELIEQDSFLELEQIYARQTGVTEKQKRRNYCESVQTSKGPNILSPMASSFGAEINLASKFGDTSSVYNRSFNQTNKTQQTPQKDFWKNPQVQKQPTKREDVQKRIAAYYQCLRNNGSYWRPTNKKNETANLWQCVPIPSMLRSASTGRGHVAAGEKAKSVKSRNTLNSATMQDSKLTATFNDRSQLQLRTLKNNASRAGSTLDVTSIHSKGPRARFNSSNNVGEAKKPAKKNKREERLRQLMEQQAPVTYLAKVMPRSPNRLDSNTPSVYEQFVPPIARLIKQQKIGFGNPQ